MLLVSALPKWLLRNLQSKNLVSAPLKVWCWMDGWMDGWVDGWMGGWMDGKAGLRIAYSNQKDVQF